MKRHRTLFYTLGCLTLLAVSCSKDFEKVPVEQITMDYVFDTGDSLGRNAKYFLNRVYEQLPQMHNRVGGDFLAAATDDAVTSVSGTPDVLRLSTGAFTSSAFPGTENVWGRDYAGIRDATTFINNIGVVPTKEKISNGLSLKYVWRSEARFLRAFFYFDLLKRYGGVPLVGDQVRQLGEDVELPRNTFAECVEYIVGECDAIKDSLRTYPVDNPAANSHVVTKGAVLALKARVLLYAASPLFNGGNIDAVNPLTGYTDVQSNRWQRAADAAREIINLNAYTLLPNFKEVFTVQNNSEIIFMRQGNSGTSIESSNGPVGYASANASGRTSPTQELVDAFPMKNGKSITQGGSGYNASDPYKDRDPRFYNTILYNGARWLSTDLETFEGGRSKPGGVSQQTKTSYYLRKFMGDFENSTSYSNTNHDYIHFRYAEVLLNLAEAVNESAGPTPEVYDAMMQLRKRAGINAGTDNMYGLEAGLTAAAMRAAIQNERRIELAFEEHRYWDVRRWKIAEAVYNVPLHGMQINKSSSGRTTYTVVPVQVDKFVAPKMYLYPIPYDEVVKNRNMKQNPGW